MRVPRIECWQVVSVCETTTSLCPSDRCPALHFPDSFITCDDLVDRKDGALPELLGATKVGYPDW